MSNVQTSSSTLERLAARGTFPVHARTGVCRNLFGPVDHDELNREMKVTLREMADRDQMRWNFNFETDTPLSGDYEWEEIAMDATPVFYQDSLRIEKTCDVVIVKGTSYVDVTEDDCPVQDISVYCSVVDRLSDFEGVRPKSSEVDEENRSDKVNSEKLQSKTLSCKRTSTVVLASSTTAHITDNYGKRTKTSDVKPTEHALQHAARSIPVERTPRKRIP